MRIICIYKITNPSGHIYIGQSRNFNQRLKYYKSLKSKSQPKLHNSFLKYGFENHKIEIIEHCSINELNEKEIYYIKKYNSVKCGMNCIVRGQNIEMSDETKKRYSESKKGKLNPNFGKSTWNKGIRQWENKTHPFFGKKLSKEHIEKIKKSNSKIYAKGGDNIRAVRINQFDLQGNLIKTWGSSKCIERELNIDCSSIIKNCKYKLKTCKGYIFRYADRTT